MRVAFIAVVMLVAGCESGVAARIQFDVPDDVAAEFSAESPGVLRADIDGFVTTIRTICGPLEENPFEDVVDFGFGCLGDREGRSDPVRAWIEPVTPDVTTCDGLPTAELASAPDAAWHQGESTVTWRRDFSPCGGIGEGTLLLAEPG